MESRIGQPVGQGHGKQPVELLGNYRILRLLGQGGFADVYLGEHIHLHTQAAIKVLQVRLVESNIQSFLNEARTIAHLVHPYIIRVLDFGVEANMPFLVMDYAPQGTFRQRFLQGKPLPPTALVPYVKQAASALQYAHDRKLIHRDVKPENMLLGPQEEILLSDFGFALMQTSISYPGMETAGTTAYMAPEQLQGRAQPASDQYSLAVIAYEWLTGACPFQGTFMELASQHILVQPPSLIQRVPGLSPQVAQVVMRALAKNPDERFPSMRDFAQALEEAVQGQQTPYPLSSSTFPSFSQNVSNAVQLSQPNFQPFPSQQTTNTSTRQTATNMYPTEHFSQSGLRSLQPQDRSEFTDAAQLSPLQSLEQSSSLVFYRSQSNLPPALPELPPLPQQPFLATELARQNRQAPGVSQTFPALQNKATGVRPQSPDGLPPLDMDSLSPSGRPIPNELPSLFSDSGQKPTSQSMPLVRSENFWKPSKSSTPRTLYFFVAFMLVLIIGSTAFLALLTHGQNNDLTKTLANQQPTTQAIATPTTVSQQTPVATTTNQTEQNPYGNHNGTLVLNKPLNQQDQQMQWSELPGLCTFTGGSYHVVANPANAQSQGFTICDAKGSDYTDFVYQVQITFTKATSTVGSGGLVFRGNKANTQFYFLEIFTTGNYALYRCPGANGAACPALSTSTTSGTGPIPSFHTDLGRPNTIGLVASGNTFRIYVNDQLAVGPIFDKVTSLAHSHGTIGMMSRQLNPNAITDVSFSNIKIWQL